MSNEVQRNFVNNAVYPQLERVIRIINQLEALVEDYDALQASANALPVDATIVETLDDVTSRTDVATITGAQIQTLRDVCEAMAAQLTAPQKQTLIGLMVRDLNTVIRA